MDWLHTLEKHVMLDDVNDVLAMEAIAVLDHGGWKTIYIDFMDNPFHGHPKDEIQFSRMKALDGITKCYRYYSPLFIPDGSH